MRLSRHILDRLSVSFDDERLAANAGLVVPASLAQHPDLPERFDERVDLGSVLGRANVGHEAMTVVRAMLAGADSINDCEVLRTEVTGAVLGPQAAGTLDFRGLSCAVFLGGTPVSWTTPRPTPVAAASTTTSLLTDDF